MSSRCSGRKSRRARRNHRERLFKAQNGRCFYGGTPMRPRGNSGNAATLDRVKPGSAGGRYTRRNLVLACASCNKNRRDLDPETFLRLTHNIGCGRVDLNFRGFWRVIDRMEHDIATAVHAELSFHHEADDEPAQREVPFQ